MPCLPPRNFKTSPSFIEMKQSKNWMRLGGLSALALLCLALLVGLVFTLLKQDASTDAPGDTDAAADTANQAAASSPTDLSDVGNFRSAYLQANGGREAIDRLRSLLVTGTLESGGKTVPFRSIKRHPDQGIFTMSMPEYELSFVVNGDVIWQRVEQPGMEPVDTLMSEKEARATANLGSFFDPIMHVVLDESSAIQRLVADSWEGAPTLRMDFLSAERNMEGTVHLDPETLTPVARIEEFGDGRERLVRYDDYRTMEGGIRQPFLVKTFVNGELLNRTQMEKVVANPGVPRFIFEFRGDASDETASEP